MPSSILESLAGKMHEIGIVRQILHTVAQFAEENQITEPIAEVVVECGELSQIIPEYLEELYPVVTRDSILQNSSLVIHVVPGLAECDECDEIFNVVVNKGYCPNCGSFEKTVLSGREFQIKEIHVAAGQTE